MVDNGHSGHDRISFAIVRNSSAICGRHGQKSDSEANNGKKRSGTVVDGMNGRFLKTAK